MLGVTDLSHDPVLTELFWPLSCGARLWIASPETVLTAYTPTYHLLTAYLLPTFRLLTTYLLPTYYLLTTYLPPTCYLLAAYLLPTYYLLAAYLRVTLTSITY